MPNLAGNESFNLSYNTDQREKGVFVQKLNKPVLGLGTHIFGPNPGLIMSPTQKVEARALQNKPHRQSAANDMNVRAIKEI